VLKVETIFGLTVPMSATTFARSVATPAFHLVLTEGIPPPATFLGVYQLLYTSVNSVLRAAAQPAEYLEVKYPVNVPRLPAVSMTLYMSIHPAGQVPVAEKSVQLAFATTVIPLLQGIVERESELVLGTKLSARKAASALHAAG